MICGAVCYILTFVFILIRVNKYSVSSVLFSGNIFSKSAFYKIIKNYSALQIFKNVYFVCVGMSFSCGLT